MKKYLLVDILLFWSGMSREKILLHRLEYSLQYERRCFVLLGFWKAGSLARSYSGPEVEIWGWEGKQV